MAVVSKGSGSQQEFKMRKIIASLHTNENDPVEEKY